MDVNGANFDLEISALITMVQSYEDNSLQEECLQFIPMDSIKEKVEERLLQMFQVDKEELDFSKQAAVYEEAFFQELVLWFKKDFFSWPEPPLCEKCNMTTNFSHHRAPRTSSPSISCFEVYECPICKCQFDYPRYVDARILLRTRKGRCSEWSQVFCLLCRSLGWKARYVIDFSDHVWVEIYSEERKRWIHCDPCEAVVDNPLLYEIGWKKDPYIIIGIGADDIQDVTWRYSCNHAAVRDRRNDAINNEILNNILHWRAHLQENLPKAHISHLKIMLVQELVEFLEEPKATTESENERSSGSLDWRISRGEASSPSSQALVDVELRPDIDHSTLFRPDTDENAVLELPPCEILAKGEVRNVLFEWKPTPSEVTKEEMNIFYNCADDIYSRDVEKKSVLSHGWKSCVYSYSNLFRKVESDWRMVYLARKEGYPKGTISWKINTEDSKTVIDTITISCKMFNVRSGQIKFELKNDHTQICLVRNSLCINDDSPDTPTTTRGDSYETGVMRGSTFVMITAHLLGGDGILAWQHSQLFRQPSNDKDSSLHIKVTLKEKEK